MRVVAILQARMGSTRLPGKVMLPLAGKPMVQNIIERVQRAKRLDNVILTVPDKDYLSFEGVNCWVDAWMGDENDLVGRYLKTAIDQRADIIVRIPCDNPCVEPEYIDKAVESYLACPVTFYSNTTAFTGNPLKIVDGIGAEVFSISRLKWLDEKTRDNAEEREHPHKWFYRYNDSCDEGSDSVYITLPYSKALRLDVNTQADYEFINDIYQHFGHNRFHVSEVLTYLATKEGRHETISR